jgi:hypothetical protein
VNTLRNFAALWNFILLLAVFATLGCFFYSVFLRKILRARRIASRRSLRIMREAASRGSKKGKPLAMQTPPDDPEQIGR